MSTWLWQGNLFNTQTDQLEVGYITLNRDDISLPWGQPTFYASKGISSLEELLACRPGLDCMILPKGNPPVVSEAFYISWPSVEVPTWPTTESPVPEPASYYITFVVILALMLLAIRGK